LRYHNFFLYDIVMETSNGLEAFQNKFDEGIDFVISKKKYQIYEFIRALTQNSEYREWPILFIV
jgi:hypothetical protein